MASSKKSNISPKPYTGLWFSVLIWLLFNAERILWFSILVLSIFNLISSGKKSEIVSHPHTWLWFSMLISYGIHILANNKRSKIIPRLSKVLLLSTLMLSSLYLMAGSKNSGMASNPYTWLLFGMLISYGIHMLASGKRSKTVPKPYTGLWFAALAIYGFSWSIHKIVNYTILFFIRIALWIAPGLRRLADRRCYRLYNMIFMEAMKPLPHFKPKEDVKLTNVPMMIACIYMLELQFLWEYWARPKLGPMLGIVDQLPSFIGRLGISLGHIWFGCLCLIFVLTTWWGEVLSWDDRYVICQEEFELRFSRRKKLLVAFFAVLLPVCISFCVGCILMFLD